MRVFVGIPVSKKLGQQIKEWRITNLKGINIRFIKPKDLHLTLIPPWNTENVAGVIKKSNTIQEKIIPFEIQFNKVTFGPKKRFPRLIWAEGETTQELLHLYKLVHQIYEKPKEKRSFTLHLTLARFKPKDFHNLKSKKLDRNVYWKQTVDKVSLFESRLSREGAKYEVLSEIKF